MRSVWLTVLPSDLLRALLKHPEHLTHEIGAAGVGPRPEGLHDSRHARRGP